jgi:hypothetical protein
MNTKKYIKIVTLALCALSLSSCEDWLDVNSDPSFPQEAPAEVLLPPMLQEMARGEGLDARVFGCYVQNFANTAAGYAFDVHGYLSGNDAGGEKWRQHYWAIGKNVDLIIEDAEPAGKWGYVGVAYAIRAWSWQTTTDVYGEMILKQAWEPGRYSFDYDTQEEVYAEVVRLCNLSLEYLAMDDQSNSLAKGDLIYKGDVAKWRKFVYSILARNAHHISNKASYDPDAVIAFVDQAMTSNADNFVVPHQGGFAHSDGGNNNIYGPTRANYNLFRQANYSIGLVSGSIDLVNGTITGSGVIDPRRVFMFQPSTDGAYRGGINGSTMTTTGTTGIPTLYGKYIYRDNAELPLMTYWEMQFMKAEAAFKKGDLATAHAAYINGITAHMDYTTVTAPARTTYLASAAVAQTPATLTLSAIMLQKYISLHGHGALETWVDMRRYRYNPTVYTGFSTPSILFATNNTRLSSKAAL